MNKIVAVNRRGFLAGLGLAIVSAACGGGAEEEAVAPDSGAAEAVENAAAPAGESVGSVSFSVEGEVKQYEFAPELENRYTKLASTVRVRPSAGATEELAINFMSMDLKTLELPMDLPGPKDLSSGNMMAAMANIGFVYVSPEGEEWAGPSQLRVESFGSDGVLTGTFTDVSLPHVDKEMPNVVLTDGSFRVRITSPF